MELKEHRVEQGKDYIANIIVEEDEEIIRTYIFKDYGNLHYEEVETIEYKKE